MPRHQSPPHNTWAAQKSTFWPFLAPHRRAERSGNRAAPAPTPGAWQTRSAPGPPGAPRGLPRSRSRCLSRAAPRLHTHPEAPGPLPAAPGPLPAARTRPGPHGAAAIPATAASAGRGGPGGAWGRLWCLRRAGGVAGMCSPIVTASPCFLVAGELPFHGFAADVFRPGGAQLGGVADPHLPALQCPWGPEPPNTQIPTPSLVLPPGTAAASLVSPALPHPHPFFPPLGLCGQLLCPRGV